jgi:FkbM family methyltransferase
LNPDVVDAAMLGIGIVARRSQVPGRSYLARWLNKIAGNRELIYRDQWGFRRAAVLTDYMEALGFVGYGVLPPRIERLIRPGDWVADIGANVGRATAQLCHLTGPTGRIWAVEPFARNALRLRRFKELSRLDNLTVFEGALSSETGQSTMYLHPEGKSAFGSLANYWEWQTGVPVATWSLDDLVADAPGQGRLAFVKLDVEGWEPRVLDGAEKTLREMRPAVFAEFNDRLLKSAGSSANDLLDRFTKLGYRPVEEPPPLVDQVIDLLMVAG